MVHLNSDSDDSLATVDLAHASFFNKVRVAVLGSQFLLLMYLTLLDSPTENEPAFIAAGITHWRTLRFTSYSVNPPLPKLIASLPCLIAMPDLIVDDPSGPPVSRPEFLVGASFARRYASDICAIVSLGRIGSVLLSLLGTIVVGSWAKQLYGMPAGIAAMVLWAFDPLLLAYSHLATSDMPATSLGVVAALNFSRLLRAGGAQNAAIAGVSLGLCVLAKFTWLPLVGLWIVLSGLHLAVTSSSYAAALMLLPRRLGEAVLVVAVSVLIINAGYGFTRALPPRAGDSFNYPSNTLYPEGSQTPCFELALHMIRTCMRPLVPAALIEGVDLQIQDFDGRFARTYIAGRVRDTGVWWYYLYGLCVKLPVSTIVLIAIGLCRAVYCCYQRAIMLDEIVIACHFVFVLLCVSIQTTLNRHVRYALPCLPFVLLLAAGIFCDKDRRTRNLSRCDQLIHGWLRHLWVLRTHLPRALVLASIVEVALSFPYTISFVNVFAGGAKSGYKHVSDSSLEWGQTFSRLMRILSQQYTTLPILGTPNAALNPSLYNSKWTTLSSTSTDLIGILRSHERVIVVLSCNDFAYSRNSTVRGLARRLLHVKPDCEVGYTYRIYSVSAKCVQDVLEDGE